MSATDADRRMWSEMLGNARTDEDRCRVLDAWYEDEFGGSLDRGFRLPSDAGARIPILEDCLKRGKPYRFENQRGCVY